MTVQDVMNTEVITVEGKEIIVADSREVARVMEMEHSKLLRKVDGINEDFTEAKIGLSKYWMESDYKDGSGKSNRNYLITKRGCEFLAHKTIGKKGNLFTDKYMDAFEKMEEELRNKQRDYYSKLSPQMKAIFNLDIRQQEQEKHLKAVDDDLQEFKNNAPLFNNECDELQAEVKRVALRMLGGKNAPAYKYRPTATKVFSDIQHQLKREFDVVRYKAIKRKDLEKAKEILKEYKLPTYLKEEVELINNQVEMH